MHPSAGGSDLVVMNIGIGAGRQRIAVDILLVVLFSLTFTPYFEKFLSPEWAAYVVLMLAIGGVSWLTMARVIRGQVLSLKEQPFVEAARASGAGTGTILWRHILPNLVGPIMVYATLIVPQAILQESFLSFLGIGVQPPLPSWGNLAAVGLNVFPAASIVGCECEE